MLLERMSHIQDGDTLREITEETVSELNYRQTFSENGLRVLSILHLRRWNRSMGLYIK